MQRALRFTILACALGALPVPHARAAPPSTPRPPAVIESEALAARAFEAYQRRDHATALTLYRQALAAAPSADITYNIARVCDLGLRDSACAIEFYARYVGERGAAAPRLERAQRRLTELRAAAAARVEAAPQNGAPQATAANSVPVQPAPLAAGAAHAAESATLAPAARLSRREPAPPRRVAESPEPAPSALEVGAIVAGSVGLVGLSLGVGFGLAARADLEESARYCDYDRCSSQRGVDAARSASRSADVATIGFAAGGALLGLSALLWLLDGSREEAIGSSELSLQPELGLDHASIALTGSFGS